jgi:hypothetical protein
MPSPLPLSAENVIAACAVEREIIDLCEQEPPDAASLMSVFPPQEPDKHECEEPPVGDKSNKNVDFGCRRICDFAKAATPMCAKNSYAWFWVTSSKHMDSQLEEINIQWIWEAVLASHADKAIDMTILFNPHIAALRASSLGGSEIRNEPLLTYAGRSEPRRRQMRDVQISTWPKILRFCRGNIPRSHQDKDDIGL